MTSSPQYAPQLISTTYCASSGAAPFHSLITTIQNYNLFLSSCIFVWGISNFWVSWLLMGIWAYRGQDENASASFIIIYTYGCYEPRKSSWETSKLFRWMHANTEQTEIRRVNFAVTLIPPPLIFPFWLPGFYLNLLYWFSSVLWFCFCFPMSVP